VGEGALKVQRRVVRRWMPRSAGELAWHHHAFVVTEDLYQHRA
jgi:hypothetical protein